MKKIKYTGINRADSSYTFETEDRNWYGEIYQGFKISDNEFIIDGYFQSGENESYMFEFNGSEIRLWNWNPHYCNPDTGLWGRGRNELNVHKYLPKFIQNFIKEVYTNLKVNPDFYL